MPPNKVERVRGAHDVSPHEYAYRQQVGAKLQQCFQAFGYRPIELPIVEHDELYLLKSGEEVISKMYEFVHQNSHLCLRPEMTASVARAYVDDRLGPVALPVRFQYSGAVFQSDRQFTQVGIESIGAGGVMADAEIIAATCRCLANLEVKDFRVVIGHMGIAAQFLASLGLEDRLQSLLLSNMSKLQSPEGKASVKRILTDIYPNLDQESGESGNLWKLFDGQSDEKAKRTVLELLSSLNIELSGNRSEGEIADRLLTKIKRQDRSAEIQQALGFLEELGQIRGDLPAVLQRAADLLDRYQCDSLALQDLQETANLLQAYNVDERKIMVDFGMAKDFQYYTGLVFEVLHPTLGAGQPLCGGGRYDDLIANLGGNPTPATGCSFDLDRLLLALKAENRFSPKIASTEVLVIAEASHAYAIQVAEGLRQAGISVQLDRTRKPPISNLPWTIRVGAAEQQQQTVRLEREGRQQLVTLPAAIHQIQQKN
jgi:ATP phosphoribosyltransferase regulatory subunit